MRFLITVAIAIFITQVSSPLLSQSFGRDRITMSQASKIAELHNQYLKSALSNFNFEVEDKIAELANQFEAIVSQNADLSGYDYTLMTSDKSYTINDLQSEVAKSLVNDFIEDVTLTSFSVIEGQIRNFQASIKAQDFTSTDHNALLVFSEVYLASAEFWLPIEKGGNGIGHNAIVLAGGQTPNAEFWGDVVAADAASAAGGMISGALIACFLGGPVTAGAFFGRVALGAAFSSGYTWLRS